MRECKTHHFEKRLGCEHNKTNSKEASIAAGVDVDGCWPEKRATCQCNQHREHQSTTSLKHTRHTTMATTAIVVADPAKGIKVDAGIIAQPFRDEIKERVLQLHKHGIGA
jgi:hypothetical protein